MMIHKSEFLKPARRVGSLDEAERWAKFDLREEMEYVGIPCFILDAKAKQDEPHGDVIRTTVSWTHQAPKQT